MMMIRWRMLDLKMGMMLQWNKNRSKSTMDGQGDCKRYWMRFARVCSGCLLQMVKMTRYMAWWLILCAEWTGAFIWSVN